MGSVFSLNFTFLYGARFCHFSVMLAIASFILSDSIGMVMSDMSPISIESVGTPAKTNLYSLSLANLVWLFECRFLFRKMDMLYDWVVILNKSTGYTVVMSNSRPLYSFNKFPDIRDHDSMFAKF